MKRTALIFFYFGLAITALSQTASPELISSAGDYFNNLSYQLEWSLGECVTSTLGSGPYTIAQGFHQHSYNIETFIDNLSGSEISISVYPNPATDRVSIRLIPATPEHLKYILFDINGKILLNEEIVNVPGQLNFSSYNNGVYFLNIKRENRLIKSFKIIKTDPDFNE